MTQPLRLALAILFACLTAACSSSAHARATSPTTLPVPTGMRVVSYHGVHVFVPSAWPVVDGMHTVECGGGPFPTEPTAFVGPNENGSPLCPAILHPPAHDGVWLQPGNAPPNATPVVGLSGASMVTASSETQAPIEDIWYHGIDIGIGLGPNRAIAAAIVRSIGYTASVADTSGSGACARNADPQRMPQPERPTAPLVLQQGNVTLAPPRPSDQPVVSAEHAWTAGEPLRLWFERYRVILARYSSTYPAKITSHGDVPENQDILAWVIYSVPTSPNVKGCGLWGLEAQNARTGASIGGGGWAPGP